MSPPQPTRRVGPLPALPGPDAADVPMVPSAPPFDRRYAIVREIARGGMGVVVEARHLYTRRSVAIKRMLAEWRARPDVVARFALETAVLGSVSHPNIVEALDAALDETGARYLVMERLVGRSIEGLLLSRPTLALGPVREIARAVVAALEALHAAGFCHRDLKPGNVLLAHDPFRGDVVKLIDFGLVGELSRAPARAGGGLTAVGEALGTPAYMAPEQFLGARVDASADVHGLGATLYECLSGQPPRPSEASAFFAELTAGVAPRPIRDLRPDVPDALAELIDAALAVEPSSRPDLAAFAAALGPATARDESAAPEADAPAPVLLWRRRHPRFAFVAQVRLVADDGRVVHGRTEEISRDGLQLRIARGARVERGVRIELEIPGGAVVLFGDVRWSRASARWQVMGLSLGPESTGRLAAFVDDLAAWYRNQRPRFEEDASGA